MTSSILSAVPRHAAARAAASAAARGGHHWLESTPRAADLSRDPLPPPSRPDARLAVLDITKWFGEASGGVKTYLQQKADYVAARPQLRGVLVLPGSRDGVVEGDGVRAYRLRGPRIPFQQSYRFLLAVRTVPRLVAHERPDVIEVGSPYLVPWQAALAARESGVPLVGFYHTSLPGALGALLPPGLGRRALERAADAYLPRVASLFRCMIASSRFAAEDLARAGVAHVERIPLGVDLAHFHPSRRAHALRTRRRLGLPEGPLAIYVGRLHPEKEVDVAIDAWTEVERRTGAHLVCIGDGPAERALRARVRARCVHFLPHIRDRALVADVHAAADLLVAPGPNETFGLSAIEALASGTPVLSVDRGGVREQVEQSGAGAVYPRGDAHGCAEVAIRLLHGDLAGYGRLGRAYAEREHDWDTVFDRLFDVYRRVTGR